MENSAYKEETISFKPGDVLVIYSDGITEAMNEEEEQFGEEGLEPVIREHIDLPAEDLIDKIVEAARAFAGDQPQMDDMTLLVIKRTEP